MVYLFYYTKEGKINKKELKQINNKHIAVMKCVYNMVHKVEIEMYEMSHVSQQPVTLSHFHVHVEWLSEILLNFKIKSYVVTNIMKMKVSARIMLIRFLKTSLERQ